jgi:hypothetical protein
LSEAGALDVILAGKVERNRHFGTMSSAVASIAVSKAISSQSGVLDGALEGRVRLNRVLTANVGGAPFAVIAFWLSRYS